MPNPIVTRRILLSGIANPILSSSESLVDGLFHVTIVLGSANSSFSTSNVTVTNGACQYVHSIDNINWTAFIMPDGVGSVLISCGASNVITVTLNPAWEFLTQSDTSNLYYDFRELVGYNNQTIQTYDPAMLDYSGNGRTLTKINTGVIESANDGFNYYRDLTSAAMSIGSNGATFLNQNFSVVFRWQPTDGQSASVQHICGNRDATTVGISISIQTNGKLRVSYIGFVWDSTNIVFANGVCAASTFSIHFDFTTDVLTVIQDGATVAGSFTTSDISATDPATFGVAPHFYIGSANNNGVAFSNPDTASLYYFAVTKLQTTPFTEVSNYLDDKVATLELVSTLTDANYLKYPHDVLVSADMTKAFVSGKGDHSATNIDGSFAIIDLATPATPSVLGGYYGHSDQNDGETVLILSSSRVMHFVDDACLLFNVSNPVSPTLVRTVANANGVVNGAVQQGNYVFGANKGGFIDVFDVSTIDTFTLVGSFDTSATMIGPHDIDMCEDGEHIIISAKTVGAQFGIIKVINSGTLIPIGSWTFASSVTSAAAPDLTGSNRIRRFMSGSDELAVLFQLDGGGATGDNVVTYNINTKSAPAYLDSFDLSLTNQRGSTGACVYRNKYALTANDQGVRILDVTTNPSDIIQNAGYFNTTAFALGLNGNMHDIDWWFSGQNRYCIATMQNEGIAIFKINRI